MATFRHAVARTTGATTWARKEEDDEWRVTCLNHNTDTTAPNRGKAWTTSSHPHEWCAKCKAIAAGKGKRIEDGRLDIPKAKPTRKASPAKAKPTATSKKAA